MREVKGREEEDRKERKREINGRKKIKGNEWLIPSTQSVQMKKNGEQNEGRTKLKGEQNEG